MPDPDAPERLLPPVDVSPPAAPPVEVPLVASRSIDLPRGLSSVHADTRVNVAPTIAGADRHLEPKCITLAIPSLTPGDSVIDSIAPER